MRNLLLTALTVVLFGFGNRLEAQKMKLRLVAANAPLPTAHRSSQQTNATTSCTQDTILLSSQADIDNFSSNYPSCIDPKYLIIDGSNASPAITNLDGLSSLTQVTQRFSITYTSIISLSPLVNLTFVDTLDLQHDPLLQATGISPDSLAVINFVDLPALVSIENLSLHLTSLESINIDSTALPGIHGLLNVQHVNGGLSISHSLINSLDGLANLETVGGWLNLDYDLNLSSLGIHNLTYTYGFLFRDLPNLTSLEDISYHLTNHNISTFWMIHTGLSDLSGLDSIEHCPNFYLWSDSNLTSLHGLEKLTGDVYYGISMHINPLLTDISALSNITSMNDGDAILELDNCESLTNATGLGNITNIGGNLQIANNPLLTSLNFLNSSLTILNTNGDESLNIYYNPQLAVCNFPPICSYLSNGLPANITDNAPGCENIAEVEAGCNIGGCANDSLTWNGSVSNNWNDPDNWTPTGVPGTCTKVTIPSAYSVPDYPQTNNSVFIGGLIMQDDAELNLNNYSLSAKDILSLTNAHIYNGVNIKATDVYGPTVINMNIEGNFSLLEYTGESKFWYNTIHGNTILSDSNTRVDNSTTFLNSFQGNLTIINNSDYGNNYLSNASPGNDYVSLDLKVINNSSANISVGMGAGNPLKVYGNFIVDASNGRVDINNFTFAGNAINHITQLGTLPITIENLYLMAGQDAVLDQNVYINNSLNFTPYEEGIVTDSNKLLILNKNCYVTGNSYSGAFVKGPVKKIGNQAFTFPVGKIENNTVWYAPLTITAPASDTDEFTAEYFHHNPNNDGYDTSLYTAGFGGISGREYWKLTRDNGNSKVKVTLPYDSARSGPAYLYQYLQMAGWDGNLWKSWGTGGFTGAIYGGTLISGDSLSSFGPLALSFKPARRPIITISNLDSIRCLNQGFNVPYTADTAMVAGNRFRIEVSDTLGNFNNFFNPTCGAKVTSAVSDSIPFLAFFLLPYKHYKIRLVGDLLPDTSVNTRNIMFTPQPQQAFTVIGPNPACVGGIEKYYPSLHEPGTTYTWTLSFGGTFTTVGDTAFVTWTNTGQFNLVCYSSNGCGNGPQQSVVVFINQPLPTSVPTINNIGRWLFSSQAPVSTGYHWFRNGTLIPGATSSSYYASLAGVYTIAFFNTCGNGPVSNSISFAANSIAQTINFPALSNKTYGDAPFVPDATASSGLPVSFSIVSGPATINSQTNVLTITGTGSVTVKASQTGDNVYDTAATVTRSFIVSKAIQTITFPSIPDQDLSNVTVTLSGTASSALPITYNIVSGPATVTGSVITLTGIGTVTVRANQPGDTNYLPAANVDKAFCTSVRTLNQISGYTNLCPGTATYTVNNITGATYFWRIAGGSTIPSTTSTANVTWASPGTYMLLVSANGNCGTVSTNDTLVVNVISSIQPDSVQSMLPANNAINQQLPLTLSWVPAHPANFYTFDLYLWRADLPQPSTPYAANLTSVNYTMPISSGLQSNQAYKWMIVSHNGSCTQITTGPIQQFTLIPLPDLQVQNVQAPTTAFSGQTVSINWTIKNNGPGNTNTNQSWTDAVFLSFDTIPNFNIPPNTTPTAWNQGSFPVRPLLIGTKPNVSALDNGQQYTNSINFTLPLNYSQPLYVYVISNYPASGNAPQQVTFANDTARAPQPIMVTLSPTPDLRVDTVFTPSTTFSGSTINLTYKVKNYGALTPSGVSWTDKMYISQSPIFNINTSIPIKLPKSNGTYYANALDATRVIQNQLVGDSSYTVSMPVVIPNYIFGSYFIYVFTNANGSLYEGALANNNTNRNQVQIFLTPTPHLTVSSFTVPVTTASTTQSIGANWNIQNTGFNDNLEKNKGHYIVQNGPVCYMTVYCTDPVTHNQYACGTVPGVSFTDSLSFGSSYWLDRVYLSTDSSALNTGNAILLNEATQGVLNSGLNVSEIPLIYDCAPAGTVTGALNVNTFNVIKPASNHPKAANFTIPDNLLPGNYYVWVLTNATNTVYQYPGIPETRRSALPITVQRPDARVSAVTVPASTTGGQTFAINYSIVNNGPGTVFNHVRRDKIYVSTSAVFDGSAQLISTQVFTEDLAVGAPVSHTLSYTFPVSTFGARYFYVHTNFDSAFRETNANNNISNAAFTVVNTAIANDLTVSSIQLADTLFAIYPTYFKYTVSNSGTGTTAGTWRDSIFISCSPTFSPATSYFLTYRNHNEIITGGGHYSDSFNVNIPFTFNINSCFPQTTNTTAYYYVKTNADNVVFEGPNGNNDVAGSGIKPTINPLVDHIVTVVTGPDTATVARPYLANWTVKNIGYNPDNTYYNYWYDAVYFSPDSTFNNNAVLATYWFENSALNTNQTYSDSKIATPPNIPTGDYYVFAKTAYNNSIGGEKVVNNNTNLIRNGAGAAKKIHVIQPLLPDLTDSILSAPVLVATGQPITIVHRTTNNGAGVTYPSNWSNDTWLSSDFIPGNAGDIWLSAKNHVGDLQPGQHYDDTSTATISLNVTPGNYVLISRVNATGNVFESNSTNDLAFKYITVYRPAPADLIVENVMKPDTVFLGYSVDTAKWVIRNIAPNSAVGVSSDGIYLSHSNVLDSTAILLGIKNKTINMGPLSRDTISLMPVVNNVTEGNYNVIVKTDLLNNIFESDKTNNTGISATPIYVGVKQLPLNVLTPNTLYNINRYYKLVIPDSLIGSTIMVSLKSNDSLSMVNQMFIAKGYIPSAAQFDYTYSTPNYGNQDIVMTSVTSGVYYISIRNVSPVPLVQNITIKAVKLPFSILAVQSSSGGNIGNVTVKISGSLFGNNMLAKLSNAGTTITASSVYYTNSTIVYATFNLQGKPLGIYDVTLIKPDTTMAVLANGFSIVHANNGGLNNGGGVNTGAGNGNEPGCDPGAEGGINSQLVVEIVSPAKVFGGWIFTIQINYNNPTNSDIPAQTRMLYSVDGLPVAFTQQDLGTAGTSLYLQLTEQDGPPGIIRAGGSGTITLYSRAPITFPAHHHAHFILR